MNLHFSGFLFAAAFVTEMFANSVPATPDSVVGAAFVKDYTPQGLLLAAVIFLYRELERQRKRGDEAAVAQQVFIAQQTEVVRKAAEVQSATSDRVVDALTALQETSQQQVTTYREHINTLVASALKK